MARDSMTLHVKDVEDWVAPAEREALEHVSRAEVKSAMVLASAREDTEDELVVEGRAREMSEREHRARFEEHMLLQAQGSELCHAIVGPPWAKHLFEGMRLAALRHTEMAVELPTFCVAVSSTAESVLGCSLSNTACAVVVGELVTEF
jgi:hypothetical protein